MRRCAVRVAIPADITSLDGHSSSSNLSVTTGNIFDRLVAYDVKLQPQPMLAESWDVSNDFTRVKLNLRKSVQRAEHDRFGDGRGSEREDRNRTAPDHSGMSNGFKATT